MSFYQKILHKVLNNKIVSKHDEVLVVAGGKKDRDVFVNCGFTKVTITNLDYDRGIKDYEPYHWQREDAESLSFKEDTFDWVVVHAGLHHCASPHQALCEMLRVSKKGIIVFESRDSSLNRIANKFDLAPSYEIEPCVLSQGRFGGVRNSHIPNFVYKWTENEVKKTVNSYLPQYEHKFNFYYGLLVPTERLAMSKSLIKRTLALAGKVLMPLFTFFFKKQGNLFAFVVEKNKVLQPWLKLKEGTIEFDINYAENKFNPENYTESI